jgi:hypothetical protein
MSEHLNGCIGDLSLIENRTAYFRMADKRETHLAVRSIGTAILTRTDNVILRSIRTLSLSCISEQSLVADPIHTYLRASPGVPRILRGPTHV